MQVPIRDVIYVDLSRAYSEREEASI